jgi:hypothetical protein
MSQTYDSIATTTLSVGTATVTFSAIPATFTDLVLVFSGTAATGSTDSISIRFNGDTATNYSFTNLSGNGSAASSARSSSDTSIAPALITSTEVSNNIWNIFNYSNTTTFKNVLVRANIAGASTRASVGLWRKTPEAISSITLTIVGGQNFASGCTFSLYGIKAE